MSKKTISRFHLILCEDLMVFFIICDKLNDKIFDNVYLDLRGNFYLFPRWPRENY